MIRDTRADHLRHREEHIPTRVVESLRVALGDNLIAVVLFGSRARADATAESDWDFLVIADGLPMKPFARHMFLKRLLPPDCRSAISMLARTPEEFERRLSSLYLDIALDGQIFYDARGYAAERLASLQRLIHRTELYRERSEAGDIWRWQVEPTEPWVLEWER